MPHAPSLPPELAANLPTRPVPTARRPLLGQQVLVVEDSRVAGEAIRLMCLRSGARIRRASTLGAASRHLATWFPNVVIVDLGLPDGPGTELIERLHLGRPRVDAVIGLSGDPALEDAATQAGADAFIAKPVASVAAFQEAVLAVLPADARPLGPRALDLNEIPVDAEAFRDDLAHAASLLGDADAPGGPGPQDGPGGYVAGFLVGVAASAGDAELHAAAVAAAQGGAPAAAERLSCLVRTRLDSAPPAPPVAV